VKRSEIFVVAMLAVLVLTSAVLVVNSKHENRRLVNELAELRTEREHIETEWSQLQLEEATLANHGRVEQIAREKLSMQQPTESLIIEVSEVRK
jgi:cell division protein FtsL